ncbi:Halomucin [Frankliniella fusca]|uniref:Halomucin n=1 Tax=Frankliniella fusca TaxID=407009 RepID=A0AAE1I290_9NEOP|nr:Halomucin [Frankliniella fusca]
MRINFNAIVHSNVSQPRPNSLKALVVGALLLLKLHDSQDTVKTLMKSNKIKNPKRQSIGRTKFRLETVEQAMETRRDSASAKMLIKKKNSENTKENSRSLKGKIQRDEEKAVSDAEPSDDDDDGKRSKSGDSDASGNDDNQLDSNDVNGSNNVNRESSIRSDVESEEKGNSKESKENEETFVCGGTCPEAIKLRKELDQLKAGYTPDVSKLVKELGQQLLSKLPVKESDNRDVCWTDRIENIPLSDGTQVKANHIHVGDGIQIQQSDIRKISIENFKLSDRVAALLKLIYPKNAKDRYLSGGKDPHKLPISKEVAAGMFNILEKMKWVPKLDLVPSMVTRAITKATSHMRETYLFSLKSIDEQQQAKELKRKQVQERREKNKEEKRRREERRAEKRKVMKEKNATTSKKRKSGDKKSLSAHNVRIGIIFKDKFPAWQFPSKVKTNHVIFIV